MKDSPLSPVPDAVRMAYTLIGVFCVLGLVVALSINQLARVPLVANIFFVLYSRYEPLFLVLTPAILLLATWFLIRRPSPPSGTESRLLQNRWIIPLLAGLVFLISWAGSHWIHHAHPFSMDEYGAEFQAKIFLSGNWFAPIEEKYRPYARAMTSDFIGYHENSGSWISHYLPIYAALRAPFLALGDSWLLNPLLAALSVLAVGGIARRLWPDHPEAGPLAALFLVTSSQFLATSMSAYSYPAHLCFNLWWLYLYIRNTRVTLALAPWLGVLALGLHQPFVHAVFVAPFLLRLLLQKRWGWAMYMAAVYASGLLLWYWYLQAIRPDIDQDMMQSTFGIPYLVQFIQQIMNLALLITWQPLLVVFALVAVLHLRSQPAIIHDLALSCFLTFLFYVFVLFNQGHGWGYRYYHAVLGNLALLAVLGWFQVAVAVGRVRAVRFLSFGVMAVCLILTPLRFWEMEREIRPFALAERYLLSLQDQVVLIDPEHLWYGKDLLRNDPFDSARPVIVATNYLTLEQKGSLIQNFKVNEVPVEHLVLFGMKAQQPQAKNLGKQNNFSGQQ